MTIRNALLRAFFWLVLGAIMLMGALSFYEVRITLQSEIAGNLQSGASAAMQRIDTFLFAQLENIRIWRRLEVMQDIRVNDVDKRLSSFLSRLRTGQGATYTALFCTDRQGRIVASSDPALIGRQAPAIAHWSRVPGDAAAEVQMQPVADRAGGTVALRTPVPDAFGKGDVGSLYAMLDWNAVLALLDDAAGGPRDTVLIDARGRAIGASRRLRARTDVARLDLGSWVARGDAAPTAVRDGNLLGEGSLLVGTAASGGYQHFPGLGWHMLMVEPTRDAYRPIWRLLWAMVTVLLLTLAVAVWTSTRLAGRIARPIVALTQFTRRFRKDQVPQAEPMPPTAISEVSELNRAYIDMIDALEQSREQIVRAGKLAVVGEMAAIMAHEVRTPLGILRSSAQLLERQPDLGDKERELSGYIVSETDRLNRLVTMLLECASPRPPDFKLHDLHDIAGNVLNLLDSKAQKKGVTMLREFDAADAVLACDREQLTQVFLNLVLNALHFVPEGGRVGIRTSDEPQALRVQVFDDGPGIAPESRQRVFDPFFSRREGGVGLGLTIVQQIVQVHRGVIAVTEGPWGGACFDMRFQRQWQSDQ
ncbi:MAG: ATP-binding protein [Gammaproteobacteria bacterium]